MEPTIQSVIASYLGCQGGYIIMLIRAIRNISIIQVVRVFRVFIEPLKVKYGSESTVRSSLGRRRLELTTSARLAVRVFGQGGTEHISAIYPTQFEYI